MTESLQMLMDAAHPNVYSRSVDPWKLRVYRRKILRSTFFHTLKSHSVAPGMHAYCARELCTKMHDVTSALLLFTLHFLSWWSIQLNKLK